MPTSPRRIRRPWFAVREELDPSRSTILLIVSFLLPLGIWALFSYVPFLWHPDIRLQISADRESVTTVYVAGDHLGKDFFPEFAQAVRVENEALLDAREAGTEPSDSARSVRRANVKILRHLAPAAVASGLLEKDQAEDDAALFALWGQLARGEARLSKPPLSEENLSIVRDNWQKLSARGETYDYMNLPDEPLLKLVPQGRPVNPVYLPAPHEVVLAGWELFTVEPKGDRPSMWERLRQSIWIIFAGFGLSCLIGVPLGILCGTFHFFSRLLEPFTDFFRYMPAPVFSTLLVAVFAAGSAPKIALVFIGTFFQMVLVISKTTRLLEKPLLEAAQTLGASRRQLVTRVVVPGILPNLYNDLRILLGWSWTWLVIAELIGVKSGLTEFIETQGRWRNFELVYPVIILIGIIGFTTDQILAWARKIIFPWTDETAGPFSRGVATTVLWVPRWFRGAVDARLPAVPPRKSTARQEA